MFTHVTTLDAGVPHLQGVTDLEVFWLANGPVLYSASEANGGLAAFDLTSGQAAVYHDQIGAAENRGTYGVSGLETAVVGGYALLVPAGRHDDRLAFHTLTVDGDLGAVHILGGDTALLGGLENIAILQVQGRTFMIASQWGESGFHSYEIRTDLSVGYQRYVADTDTAHIGDITAIATLDVSGRSYFFTASAEENGVTSWWIDRWGNIKERDSLDPSEGLWVSAPSALETTVVDGTGYLVMGSAGSSTLTVMKVNPWGGLIERDHVLDDRDTRFAGVSALEVFEGNGRSFLLAGGSDDGLTLFEIAPGGILIELATIADELDTRLSNVSAIETAVFGTEVQVFVTSANESGLTQFELDFSGYGLSITGTGRGDTLAGTPYNDIIMGYDGNDRLGGFDGDDVLIDGAGSDIMVGGAGADRFVFVEDRRLDTVADFTPGEDKLDLSAFPMLYDMSRLSFEQKEYGVLITYGEERFRIESEGVQLLVSDLSPDDFIF